MQVFLAAFIGGLALAAGSIAGRVVLSLGFGFIAYAGISTALSGLKSLVLSNIGAAPDIVFQILAVTKVGVSINMIFSAIAVRLVLNGLTSGVVTRFVAKGA